MLRFRQPDDEAIGRFLAGQSGHGYTYRHVGATGGELPPGYVVDHTRVKLGEGAVAFNAAKAALKRWEQFRLGWVEARPASTPIQEGAMVAVTAHLLGLWWINACRIATVIDEGGEQPRFGFAYGTLPDHGGVGEERFLIETDRTGTVWYDILAFSRPHGWLIRLGYPYMRRVQRRFGRESAARMRRVIVE